MTGTPSSRLLTPVHFSVPCCDISPSCPYLSDTTLWALTPWPCITIIFCLCAVISQLHWECLQRSKKMAGGGGTAWWIDFWFRNQTGWIWIIVTNRHS
jgi:hypothetical protein